MAYSYSPTLTAKRPATNGSDAIDSRHHRLGRPFYVALLTVVAGPQEELDDPKQMPDGPRFSGPMPRCR